MSSSVQPQDKYVVRFPDGMRDEIAAAAKANVRSMNSEIIARLAGDSETLRDRFAREVMYAILGEMSSEQTGTYLDAAHRCYAYADAMMIARKVVA